MIAKDYWNNRYNTGGHSGEGSYGSMLSKKLEWLKNLDIQSISEIGCGDFNFGSNLLRLYPHASYFGQDISEVIVKWNQEVYPDRNFTTEDIPPADLVLCIDVLFHLLEDTEVEEMLKRLESKWTKYLAVTAYEHDEDIKSEHVKIRKFDYKRFGEPIVREIIEEDGQLYFYLFKKPQTDAQTTGKIDLSKVSCVLNTKEDRYPAEILAHVSSFPFGEILILTHSDSPVRKYELINKAKFDLIYYQDDDALCPIKEIAELSKPDMINVAMKPGHFEAYKAKRMTMGFGWGAIFPKAVLSELKKYTDRYGEDSLYKRETEKILTHLHFPQNRLSLPIIDLPSAYLPNRLSFEPFHYDNMDLIEERCKDLL